MILGCDKVHLTGLRCPRLRPLYSKLSCRNHSFARNRSSAHNHSWLRSNRRSSCGGRSCRCRRAGSNDGGSKNCSSSTRNRSSAHNHSSIRKRSSTHKHSWLRSNRHSSSCRTGLSGRRASSSGERKDCSSSIRSHSSAHNHSFVHKHNSTRSHSHSCCRRTDRRRHSRFRPSRAPGRRQASQRQNIGSSGNS